MSIPIALTIAGSDCSGGAGIQADLKTFAACGVYGASVITALTAQNTCGVSDVHVVPAEFVTAQLDAVFSDLDIRAVKTGMLARSDIIEVIAAALARWTPPNLVVDPVMIATSGDALLTEEAVATLREKLLPRARLVTPNLPEAARLTGQAVAAGEDDVMRQGRALLALGCEAVLIKGGHGTGSDSTDYLFRAGGIEAFSAPRLDARNTHGTGCTLASAIAAGLARGQDLGSAVRGAKDFVTAAIRAADRLQVGRGNGPLHHFHALGYP